MLPSKARTGARIVAVGKRSCVPSQRSCRCLDRPGPTLRASRWVAQAQIPAACRPDGQHAGQSAATPSPRTRDAPTSSFAAHLAGDADMRLLGFVRARSRRIALITEHASRQAFTRADKPSADGASITLQRSPNGLTRDTLRDDSSREEIREADERNA